MKAKKIIIVLLIFNIILIGIIYNLIRKDYLNNHRLILKTMTETEYEDNITSLNQSHESYVEHVEESKVKIAEAITEMGIVTSEEDTAEIMANNIKSITTENALYIKKLCDVTPSALSNYTVNIASYLSSDIYTKLTASNFKLITNNGDYSFSYPYAQGTSSSANYRAAYIVSYTANTGKLVIYPGYIGTNWTQGRTFLKVSVYCSYQQ